VNAALGRNCVTLNGAEYCEQADEMEDDLLPEDEFEIKGIDYLVPALPTSSKRSIIIYNILKLRELDFQSIMYAMPTVTH
jgi:hypothetical protein